MNGIDKILARIQADNQAEIDEINAEAVRKCDEIQNAYDASAQEEYWKIFKKGAKDAELRVEHLGSTAALEAKKQLLAAKQEIVSSAFERAAEMLSELPEDRYVDFFSRLAADASSAGDERLIFSPDDRERVGAAVCAKANEILAASGRNGSITLSDETRDIRGGFILSRGDIEVNCSIDSLVSLKRDELASEVAGILFD